MKRVLGIPLPVFIGGLVLLLELGGPLLLPDELVDGGSVDGQSLVGPDSRFVTVDGVRLHYREWGQGSRVIILLHGFGGNLRTWDKVGPALASTGRVIAFDRPGCGLSACPMPGEWTGKSPYAPSRQPELLVGLMDALGVESAVLAGNSQGGAIALQAALAHPGRVAALILADPAVYTAGGFPPSLAWLWASPQMRKLGPLMSRQFLGESNAGALIALAWHDPARYRAEDRAAALPYGRLKLRFRALWEQTVAGEELDTASRLGELTLPVLVLAGDDDRIVPTAEHRRLAGEIKGASFVLIPDCGHVPQEEQAQLFLAAAASFLAGLAGPH